MNIASKLENKMGEFKEEEDWKLTSNRQEKKFFTVTNEELKESCWEILYQNLPSFHSSEENVLVISFKTEGGKNELIIQIGETPEEKTRNENSNMTQTCLNQSQPQQGNQEPQQITRPISFQVPNSDRNYLPWIVGGVSLIIAGIIAYLLIRKKNK